MWESLLRLAGGFVFGDRAIKVTVHRAAATELRGRKTPISIKCGVRSSERSSVVKHKSAPPLSFRIHASKTGCLLFVSMLGLWGQPDEAPIACAHAFCRT